MVDLTFVWVSDDALDRIIDALETFDGDREQLRANIFSARAAYHQRAWERANGVPAGQMFRKATQALKALHRAHALLIAAHSRKDERGIPSPQPAPWFQEIEDVLIREIGKLETSIAGGGPRRGAPRNNEFIALVKDLAGIYTRITGKEPTSTRSSPEHSRLSRPPKFHRFVVACLRSIEPDKAELATIDASIFEAWRQGAKKF